MNDSISEASIFNWWFLSHQISYFCHVLNSPTSGPSNITSLLRSCISKKKSQRFHLNMTKFDKFSSLYWTSAREVFTTAIYRLKYFWQFFFSQQLLLLRGISSQILLSFPSCQLSLVLDVQFRYFAVTIFKDRI